VSPETASATRVCVHTHVASIARESELSPLGPRVSLSLSLVLFPGALLGRPSGARRALCESARSAVQQLRSQEDPGNAGAGMMEDAGRAMPKFQGVEEGTRCIGRTDAPPEYFRATFPLAMPPRAPSPPRSSSPRVPNAPWQHPGSRIARISEQEKRLTREPRDDPQADAHFASNQAQESLLSPQSHVSDLLFENSEKSRDF